MENTAGVRKNAKILYTMKKKKNERRKEGKKKKKSHAQEGVCASINHPHVVMMMRPQPSPRIARRLSFFLGWFADSALHQQAAHADCFRLDSPLFWPLGRLPRNTSFLVHALLLLLLVCPASLASPRLACLLSCFLALHVFLLVSIDRSINQLARNRWMERVCI